jgi:hypothetical protein
MMILRFREFGKTEAKTRTVYLKVYNGNIIEACGNAYLVNTFLRKDIDGRKVYHPEERIWALKMMLGTRAEITNI